MQSTKLSSLFMLQYVNSAISCISCITCSISMVHLIKKVNILCLFAWVRMCYVLLYRRCVGHIVQPKSKQDGGIRSARQFRMSAGSGIDVDGTEKRKL